MPVAVPVRGPPVRAAGARPDAAGPRPLLSMETLAEASGAPSFLLCEWCPRVPLWKVTVLR